MKLFYDLHLHSCLSPCGSEEMTPNNLVNMAKLLGYDIVALTDHNTAQNTPAAVAAGRQAGIAVVPGMELCTAEEAHVICLFPTTAQALAFEEEVVRRSPPFANDPAIFGRQLVLDENDTLLREEPRLLIGAAEISVNEARGLTRQYGGTAFPAHVDRPAYSVLASLGALPPEAQFLAAEFSLKGDAANCLRKNPELENLILMRNSDAHYLENMPDPRAFVDLPEAGAACLIAALENGSPACWNMGG